MQNENIVVAFPVRPAAPAFAVSGNNALAVTVPVGAPYPFVPPVSNLAAIMELRNMQRVETPATAPLPLGPGSATVDRAALAKGLAALAKVVEKRNTIPVLSNVRLTATAGGLCLTATDLDMVATFTVPGECVGRLDITVSCHRLLDIVKRAKASDTVSIEYTGGEAPVVHFGFAGLRIDLQSIVAGDFPELSAGEFSHSFRMHPVFLANILAKVEPAISTEETRYYLNGVYIHRLTNSTLRFAATDGHRLVTYELGHSGSKDGMPGCIIPRKAVAEWLRNAKAKGKPYNSEDTVTVELSDTRSRLTIGPLVLTSKHIDGVFPDYERVIPRSNEKRLVVDVAELTAAIEQVGVIHSDKGRACKFSMEGGKVTLSTSNPDAGTATMAIAASFTRNDTVHDRDDSSIVLASGERDAEPLDIGFNSTYMREMLALIGSDTVEMRLSDPGSPTLFLDSADSGFTGVLMPMRV